MSRRGLGLFAVCSVAWGLPFYCVGVLAHHVSPQAIAFWRCFIGALVLLPVVLKVRRPRGLLRRRSAGLVLFALTQTVIPFYLIADAQKAATSAFAGVIIASWPLIGIGFAVAFIPGAIVTRGDIAGMALGLLGVIALVGLDTGRTSPRAVIELVGVATLYASAPAILRQLLADIDSATSVFFASFIAVITYSPFAFSGARHLENWGSLAAILTLGAVSTASALLAFSELIVDAGPVKASLAAYSATGVAVLVGVLVAGDAVTPGLFLGLGLIIGGSLIATFVRGSPPEVKPSVVDVIGADADPCA